VAIASFSRRRVLGLVFGVRRPSELRAGGLGLATRGGVLRLVDRGTLMAYGLCNNKIQQQNQNKNALLRWCFPEEQGSRCWTRNGGSRAKQTYFQKHLQPAGGAQGPAAHTGPGERGGRRLGRPGRARSLYRRLTALLLRGVLSMAIEGWWCCQGP
jgi:hypothetical protein